MGRRRLFYRSQRGAEAPLFHGCIGGQQIPPCVAGAPAAVGMTTQNLSGVRFVEAHLSQRT
jgi:hypothetical protein